MGLLDALKNNVQEEVNKAEEPQTPVAPETPEEPKSPEEPVEEAQTPTPNRSAYNCPDCKGEGLTEDQTARCVTCNGTGRVN